MYIVYRSILFRHKGISLYQIHKKKNVRTKTDVKFTYICVILVFLYKLYQLIDVA